MIMADVLKYFLVIAGTMVVFVSFWLAVVALFPAVVVRAEAQYNSTFKLLGIGLASVLPLTAIAIFVLNQNNPAIKVAGFVLLSVIIAIGLMGSSGVAQRVGRGLPSPVDETQPWRRVYRGGTVLVLVFLLPMVGWFVILPVTLITGFAAALLSFSGKNQPAPAQSQMQSQPMPVTAS